MPAAMAIGAAAQGVASLISATRGIFQNAKANKMAKNNKRPDYIVPKEVTANQNLAQQQATMGMPGAQMTKAVQGIARQGNTALSRAQDRRGGLAAIGAIQQGSNDAGLNLAVADSQQRMSNIRNLMQQNNVMAQYRDKAWQWNTQSKFLENAAAIRALKGAGNENINRGLDGLLSAGASLAGGMGGGGGSAPQQGAPPMPGGGAPNWTNAALPFNDFRIKRY